MKYVKEFLKFNILILLFCFSISICHSKEENLLEVDLIPGDKVLSIPFPQNRLPLNSLISVLVSNKSIPVTIGYGLLWPDKKGSKISVRLLNLSFDEPSFADKATILWHTSSKNIVQSSKRSKYNGRLIYPDMSWLREVLLLTNNEGIDEKWYRHNQRLVANYLADDALLIKNKYPRTVASQWLYDRAQAFYQLFMGTGEGKWKLHADRFVVFYKNQINKEGFFKLSKPKDVKYLMGRSLVYDYILNQNYSSLVALSGIYEASLSWPADYSISSGFWTERHHAAALNVAISYWEISGDMGAKARIEELIRTLSYMTFAPQNGWVVRGCPQHSFKSHEGWGDATPVCSPWMMALLSDSLWRFYLLTGDDNSKKLLSSFADFILNEAIYYGYGNLKDRVIPKYIVSLNNKKQEELDQWSDAKHTCDVATMVGKGVFIKKKLELDHFLTLQLFKVMSEQCKKDHLAVVEKYKYVKMEYFTISPPRKFNWQYSTTDDLPWLMSVTNN